MKEIIRETIKRTSAFKSIKKIFYQSRREGYHKTLLSESETNKFLANKIRSRVPLMVSRVGSVELKALALHLKNRPYTNKIKNTMLNNAGFFPVNDQALDDFTKLFGSSISNVDLMGIWFNPFEDRVVNRFCPNAELTRLRNLEPYFSDSPWSQELKDSKVLVINPFSESIQKQYKKREKLFTNTAVLPDFDLITYKPVQSIGGSSLYSSWFEALREMQQDISNIEFDIAIIGAGAYGLPLASFIKSIGKQAIHLGGSSQMLFGVYGRRWEIHPDFKNIINEHWVRPSENEKPRNAAKVENACYW